MGTVAGSVGPQLSERRTGHESSRRSSREAAASATVIRFAIRTSHSEVHVLQEVRVVSLITPHVAFATAAMNRVYIYPMKMVY